MRRFLTFGAIAIAQGMAIVPVGAQSQAGRAAAGQGAYDTPSAVNQGSAYPSGQYGYSNAQPYPAQAYPSQSDPTQSYPTQSDPTQSYPAQPRPARPAPPQATPPGTVCTGGRFFDHMTKSCESP